jgi:hypothetical protein
MNQSNNMSAGFTSLKYKNPNLRPHLYVSGVYHCLILLPISYKSFQKIMRAITKAVLFICIFQLGSAATTAEETAWEGVRPLSYLKRFP